MPDSRVGPNGGESAAFGLAALIFLLTPTGLGPQDVAASIAREPAVRARWREHIASPFGTIHAATFSLPRPIGTAIPEPVGYRLASLDPRDPEITGATPRSPLASSLRAEPLPIVFPLVNRAAKGDRLVPARPVPPEPELLTPPAGIPMIEPAAPVGIWLDEPAHVQVRPAIELDEIQAAARFEPFPEYDISLSLELRPQVPADDISAPVTIGGSKPDISLLAMANDPDPIERTARIFFGAAPLSFSLGSIEPWAAGEEPILMLPRVPDLDIKRAALAALPPDHSGIATKLPPEGQSVAGKGEVTGEGRHPKSPAQRLGLEGRAREKAEKCLANAVYFESRGEAVRGQLAVAQVVINRAFSGYYPSDVCGVVYQNAHRHLACQFTFACDGIADTVTEPDAWDRAKRVARAALDGRFWLAEVGKATHYHAYWVRPWWVRSMRKHAKIGVHTFYRPHKWGEGEDAPTWGTAAATAEMAAKL